MKIENIAESINQSRDTPVSLERRFRWQSIIISLYTQAIVLYRAYK